MSGFPVMPTKAYATGSKEAGRPLIAVPIQKEGPGQEF